MEAFGGEYDEKSGISVSALPPGVQPFYSGGMARMTLDRRKEVILDLYGRFHRPEFLIWDPLSVIREFPGSPDQEYIALVAALFAFGGVKQIIASLRGAVDRLGLRAANPRASRRS